MTADKTIFCFGYGYTAARLAARLRNDDWRIAGTTTHEDKANAMQAESIETHIWKGERLNPAALEGKSAVLVSTPPGEDGCPVLQGASDALAVQSKGVDWIGYLSSNSVYGDHGGAWVTEETRPAPATVRAKRRNTAETQWRRFADTSNLPLIIFRLPGIYGPGRSALDAVRKGNAKRIDKPGHIINRAHVDDIVGVLTVSMEQPKTHDIYNVADDEPAPTHEVIAYASGLLGVEPPPLTPLEQAGLSDIAKSFYSECKRISNARVKEALSIRLKYPTYREGLEAILAAETPSPKA